MLCSKISLNLYVVFSFKLISFFNFISLSENSKEYQGNNFGERFSIQTDNKGNQYVKVDTDQDIFEGIDKKDYNKIAKMYMQDYLKGNTILAGNDNANIGRRGVNKYTNPQQNTRFF